MKPHPGPDPKGIFSNPNVCFIVKKKLAERGWSLSEEDDDTLR